MTGYDPFAVDQEPLQDDKKAVPSPDDMLFADGVGASRNAPPADSSWGLIDADVDSLLPGAKPSNHGGLDFGAEVLGETMPMPAPAAKPRAAATPRPSAPAQHQPAATAGPRALEAPRREVGVKPLASGAPSVVAPARDDAGAAPAYVARKPSSVGRIGKASMAATAVPTTIFVGGGVTAAWLFEAQQNPTMAAITFALTIVGTGFARLLLRG